MKYFKTVKSLLFSGIYCISSFGGPFTGKCTRDDINLTVIARHEAAAAPISPYYWQSPQTPPEDLYMVSLTKSILALASTKEVCEETLLEIAEQIKIPLKAMEKLGICSEYIGSGNQISFCAEKSLLITNDKKEGIFDFDTFKEYLERAKATEHLWGSRIRFIAHIDPEKLTSDLGYESAHE